MSVSVADVARLDPVRRAALERRLNERRTRVPERPHGSDREEENLVLATDPERVDRLLGRFYGRFPWPWEPLQFDALDDPHFDVVMLNQDIGDFAHATIPRSPSIWVAGCGTNQAVQTALRYPTATVTGSDISATSLGVARKNAGQLGLENLTLVEESLNEVDYTDRFDFVVCTGVIHHNADPAITLSRIARALKPGGVIELMVYNRFHRIATSSFQKAIRGLIDGDGAVDFERGFDLARTILEELPVRPVLEKAFIHYMDVAEVDLADLLVQPVEHSYTVESFDALVQGAGLELLVPCTSPYVKNLARNTWNLRFRAPELRTLYEGLPDTRRWQITNLLLQEQAPLLWFYARKPDGRPRSTEHEIGERFLDTRFRRAETTQKRFLRNAEGRYELFAESELYPRPAFGGAMAAVAEAVDPAVPMREVFRRVGLEPSFQNADEARRTLATVASPHLVAVSSETGE